MNVHVSLCSEWSLFHGSKMGVIFKLVSVTWANDTCTTGSAQVIGTFVKVQNKVLQLVWRFSKNYWTCVNVQNKLLELVSWFRISRFSINYWNLCQGSAQTIGTCVMVQNFKVQHKQLEVVSMLSINYWTCVKVQHKLLELVSRLRINNWNSCQGSAQTINALCAFSNISYTKNYSFMFQV